MPDLVSRVGRKLREDLGVADVSQVESVGIRASIASNPEAMRLYSEGLAKLRTFDALAARDLLARAVNSDPAYPLAHAELAKAWMALGYQAIALQEAKTALELSGKLSHEEHSLVEARYYEVNKDWNKAIEVYQSLSNSSPDSVEYGLALTNAQIEGERGSDALNRSPSCGGCQRRRRRTPISIWRKRRLTLLCLTIRELWLRPNQQSEEPTPREKTCTGSGENISMPVPG